MIPDLHIEVVPVGEVKVPLPRYETDGAAGMDLRAALVEPLPIAPRARVKIPTGLSLALPPGGGGPSGRGHG